MRISFDRFLLANTISNATEWEPESENSKPRFSISRTHQDEKSKDEEGEEVVPESEPEPQVPREKSEKDIPKQGNTVKDPIRWFGILVPPALRSAQQSFISVVEDPVPQLATISRDLRSQEIEIGRVRKQIKKL